MTWMQFWKAEAAQQKVKGVKGVDLEYVKDQQRSKFKAISKGSWYITADMIRDYV